MAEFSFNFQVQGEVAGSHHSAMEVVSSLPLRSSLPSLQHDTGAIENPYQEILKPEIVLIDDSFVIKNVGVRNVVLKKVIPKRISLDENGSDIIPGKYEGGKKVWECSIDLVDCILSEEMIIRNDSLPLRILELGCGHGLPGIAAMLAYGSNVSGGEVVFSDLNVEVLQHITWPNILINCPDTAIAIRCCAGDWFNLSSHIGKFALILSAETLYNADCCKAVFHMIDKHLDDDGVALIASKKYYFGVGGGTFDLESLAFAADSKLEFTLVKSYEDGFSNVREIVKLTRRKLL